MSFSPKQYASAIPKSLTSLNSLILAEKTLKFAKPRKESEVDEIFAEKIDKNVKNLIKILIHEKRLKIFSKILNEFKKILFESKIATTGTITTATEITLSDLEIIKENISKTFGMPVILESKIDPSLIGGAVIKIGDWTIDNSYKRKLNKIQN